MQASRRSDVLALAAVVLALLAYFAPVWAPGGVFISDGQMAAFFAPVSLWSDAWIGGWPAGSDPAAYVFYPVRLLLRATGSFDAFVLSAYIIAALGLYAYLRLLGAAVPAAAFGALCFACSGFMVAHVAQTSMLHAAAWITPALAGIEATLVLRRRRWALFAGGAVAMACTAGHPQLAAYGLIQLCLYLGWRFRSAWRRADLRTWGFAAAAPLLGVALAAPVLLLTHAYLPETPRKTMSFETFVTYGLPASQVSNLFFPFAWGGGIAPYSTYFGAWTLPAVCIHVPFVAVLLAILGLWTAPSALGVYWLAMGAAALALAVGDGIPWLAWAVHHFPFVNLFRAPGRHAFEVCLALAILGGLGFDDWLRGGRPRRRLLAAVFVSMALLGGALALVAAQYDTLTTLARLRRQPLAAWQQNPALAVPLALAVPAAAVVLAVGARAQAKTLGIFVVLALQAAAFGWFLPWMHTAPSRASWEASPLEARVIENAHTAPGRVLNVGGRLGTLLQPERSRMLGLASLNWYGPLIPERPRALLEMSPLGAVTSALNSVDVTLDVYGVRYVAADTPIPPILDADTERWQLIGREETAGVYENRRAMPLAWLVGSWVQMADDAALETLHGIVDDPASRFDASHHAIVADGESGEAVDFDAGRVDARWQGPSALDIETHSKSGGLLVVGVNHAAPWHAELDRRPIEVRRADYALIGVAVPAGDHVVRLRFRSRTWISGALIGLATLGVFVLAAASVGREPPESAEADAS